MNYQRLSVELDDAVYSLKVGDNLLSSLLSQGADVRYGCRAGACGACRLHDLNGGESILACQIAVSSSMSLSSQRRMSSVEFSVLAMNVLDESSIEVTLLGPSDDSFGDRVFVSVMTECLNGSTAYFVECMALNQPGEPLSIILQRSQFPKLEWQQVTELSAKDVVRVQLLSGLRKGRLLYEMDLSGYPVMVVSSPENGVFEPYWCNILQAFSVRHIECFTFSSLVNTLDKSSMLTLQEEAFVSALNKMVDEFGNTALRIIYHGQKLSEKDWDQLLRPLRIRTSQLYFIR